MNDLNYFTEWKSDYAASMNDSRSLGKGLQELGPQTQRFYEKYQIARFYLDDLVPQSNNSAGSFRIFGLHEIEDSLSGLEYSEEFRSEGLFPISELSNDKMCCIDCECPGFIVLQLGWGTILPLRKFILFRAPSLARFLSYMNWENNAS